jgi:signal transduction histidine kinase
MEDSDGRKLVGNLAAVPRVEGWNESGWSSSANQAAMSGDDDHQLWGAGKFLDDGSFLFVGQDAFRVLAAQEAIVAAFAWSSGIALVIASLLGLLMSRNFLRRIDDINRTSRLIMDGQLKQRIPVRGTSDEIDRLSLNLNQLFDRNQSLLESLKQVTTSIAHDLRTPLSRLRQDLEETRARRMKLEDYRAAVDAAITDSDKLLGTFAALLRIAQIESGTRKSGFRNFDLSALVSRVASAYEPVAEDEGKAFTASVQPGIMFHGDSELLLQMTANLIENAIRHTPPGARIEVRLDYAPEASTLTIADTGPGIPIDMCERVFERFFRMESSRTTSGNGLGLALVGAVAELHGVSVQLEDNQPGLRALLRFQAV